MTRRAMLTCLVTAAWASAAGSAHAAGEDDALKPAQMVRSLQLVQDRVADGDHAALPMQRKLLEMIDKRLLTATEEELNEPASFRAVLVYAMSGGNPTTLQAVLDRVHLDEEDSHKAIGVLSYLTGGTRGAAIALKNVDPMKEPPELGAFLALIRGSVISLEDAKAYAERNGVSYRVEETVKAPRRIQSYSDNFKSGRAQSWTGVSTYWRNQFSVDNQVQSPGSAPWPLRQRSKAVAAAPASNTSRSRKRCEPIRSPAYSTPYWRNQSLAGVG